MRAPTPASTNPVKNRDPAGMLRAMDAECRNCAPLNPLECVTQCNVWKLKNELRRLRKTMVNPHFMKDLFNVLKNERNMRVLKTVVRGHRSLIQIQQELKKAGYSYSQDIVSNEYLRPLLEVGLAAETQDKYYATMFGGRLTEMLEDATEFANVLPGNSECYEETLLIGLLPGPKTFEDVVALISPKIVPRILKRLRVASLITASKDRDYVFFFRSKRDPTKETFSSTERQVYSSIPDAGISAKKLAEKNGLSTRTAYKYLRGLRGKKLIFTRKMPKVYRLTGEGEKTALLLQDLRNLVEEVWNTSEQIADKENA
jgi:predicted transcriptional regulator